MSRPVLLAAAFALALLSATGCMGPGPNVAPEPSTSRVPPPHGAPLIGADALAGSYRPDLPATGNAR